MLEILENLTSFSSPAKVQEVPFGMELHLTAQMLFKEISEALCSGYLKTVGVAPQLFLLHHSSRITELS